MTSVRHFLLMGLLVWTSGGLPAAPRPDRLKSVIPDLGVSHYDIASVIVEFSSPDLKLLLDSGHPVAQALTKDLSARPIVSRESAQGFLKELRSLPEFQIVEPPPVNVPAKLTKSLRSQSWEIFTEGGIPQQAGLAGWSIDVTPDRNDRGEVTLLTRSEIRFTIDTSQNPRAVGPALNTHMAAPATPDVVGRSSLLYVMPTAPPGVPATEAYSMFLVILSVTEAGRSDAKAQAADISP